jgi:hypothetical protein
MHFEVHLGIQGVELSQQFRNFSGASLPSAFITKVDSNVPLLVVTLSRDSDTQSVWDTLDTSLPDLLVQLGVETNVGCAL